MGKHDLATFDELLNRAASSPEWFWGAVVEDLGLEFYTPYEKVLDTSRGWEWATWFTGSQYNYVHDALAARFPDLHLHEIPNTFDERLLKIRETKRPSTKRDVTFPSQSEAVRRSEEVTGSAWCSASDFPAWRSPP